MCPGCRIDWSQPSFSVNVNHDGDQKVPSLGVPITTLKNFVSSDSPAHADSGLTLLISPFHTKQIPSAVTSFYEGNSSDKWGGKKHANFSMYLSFFLLLTTFFSAFNFQLLLFLLHMHWLKWLMVMDQLVQWI
jgi:hypothetical protein